MKYLSILFLLILSFLGCSKDSKISDFEGDVVVDFSITGIIDVENISEDVGLSNSANQREAVVNKKEQNENLSEYPKEVLLEKRDYPGQDFDAIVSLIEINQSQTKISNKIKIGATSNMGANIRYRVFIYRKSTGQFVGEINGISGSANTSSGQSIPFKISRNTEYTIIAFSWNNTTVPVITGSASSNPTITTSATNQELLYNKFDIQTNNNLSFHIPIVFKRQRASFQVEVDTKGLFAPIQTIGSSTVPTGYAQYGSLNLVTGIFNGFLNSNAGTTMSLTFNPAPSVATPLYSVVANQYFTINTTVINNFSVNLGAIRLLLDNGTTRDYSGMTYIFSNPITLERGKIKRVRIQLVATAKTLTNTTPRIRWAKTNLYYSPNATEAQGGKYRMRNHNSNIYSTATSESVISNEYWNWNALLPGADVAKTNTGDPCAQVYPAGTWRLPTRAEFEDAFTPKSSIFYAGSTDPARYMYRDGLSGGIYDSEGTDRRVAFINYGYRTSTTSNLPSGISNYSADGIGYGIYWSSTSVDANNGYVMQIIHGGASSQTINNGSSYNTVINSLSKNGGASVRCVRTASSL